MEVRFCKWRAPRLEVMMMMVLRKSTVLPRPSVNLAVFENLQENVEDVRVGLLDFVQKNNRVRRAANTLGQLTAFFVAHVTWRGADELRHGMFLHELRHIEANQRLLRTEQEFREAAGHFRFADAGGAEEEEAANGTRGIFESGAAAANGASEGGDGFVLADDALVKLRLDAQKFSAARLL